MSDALSARTTSKFSSPSIDAQVREAADGVPREGEALGSLTETAVREAIHRQQAQTEFLARGLRSSDDAKRTGIHHPAADVHDELQRRLDAGRKKVLG